MSLYHNQTIGVLALQGGWREHAETLRALGAQVRYVRCPRDLEALNGLVVPGGESTAIAAALGRARLWGPIRQAIREHGMPVFGTCAGAILLAGDLGGASCTIERNAYGAQIDSFTHPLHVADVGEVEGVFIRAPRIHDAGGAHVLATGREGEPVLIREGNMLLSTFHPELVTSDVHKLFLNSCIASSGDFSYP